MPNDIDANTAKLAGLQIDALQKLKSGNLTLGQIEWFLNLPVTRREFLIKTWQRPQVEDLFKLHIDLGTITVPDDYVHGICLERFKQVIVSSLADCDSRLTDANFSKPSRIFRPKEQFSVCLFRPVVPDSVTVDDCISFLKMKGSIYPGAQGLALFFQQKLKELPRGRLYFCFDKEESLWKAPDRQYRIPTFGIKDYATIMLASVKDASSVSDFSFLGLFENKE